VDVCLCDETGVSAGENSRIRLGLVLIMHRVQPAGFGVIDSLVWLKPAVVSAVALRPAILLAQLIFTALLVCMAVRGSMTISARAGDVRVAQQPPCCSPADGHCERQCSALAHRPARMT
jgi:hypothetical protein